MATVFCTWVDYDENTGTHTDAHGEYSSLTDALLTAAERQMESNNFNRDFDFPQDTVWFVVES